MTDNEKDLVRRLTKIIEMVRDCEMKFIEYGMFGAVAKGIYEKNDTIDLVFVTNDELFINKYFIALKDLGRSLGYTVQTMTQQQMEYPIFDLHKEVTKSYVRIEKGTEEPFTKQTIESLISLSITKANKRLLD